MSILGRNPLCLTWSVCAASELNRQEEVGIKMEGKDQSQAVVLPGRRRQQRAENTESALQGSSKSKRKRAPRGPRRAEPSACPGPRAGPGGVSLWLLSSPNSFWEEHVLWAGKLATVTINQDDMRQLLLFNESFNVLHYLVWYNHSLCF